MCANDEGRSTNDENQMTKRSRSQLKCSPNSRPRSFGIRHSSFFRHSCFGIRHWPAEFRNSPFPLRLRRSMLPIHSLRPWHGSLLHVSKDSSLLGGRIMSALVASSTHFDLDTLEPFLVRISEIIPS